MSLVLHMTMDQFEAKIAEAVQRISAPQEEAMTIDMAADFLRYNRRHLARLEKSGKLVPSREFGDPRYLKSELIERLKSKGKN